MTTHILRLELFLRLAALMQIGIALLNLFLVPLLGWKQELARVPLLLKEVFQIHAWFISFTLGIFAVMTWQFAGSIAQGSDLVCRWLAAGIGLFWAFRAILQVTYYSSSHWRGLAGRTMAHVILLVMYASFAGLYLWAGFVAR